MLNNDVQNKTRKSRRLIKLILFLIFLLLLLIAILFYRYAIDQFLYRYLDPKLDVNVVLIESEEKDLEDIDFERPIEITTSDKFSLIIPKIRINSYVITENDSSKSSKDHQDSVYHNESSVLPSEHGNTLINTSIGETIFNYPSHQSAFYLLSELELGDVFYIVYESQIYKFEIINISKQFGDDYESYINKNNNYKSVSIISNMIPGTNIYKLIVEGKLARID